MELNKISTRYYWEHLLLLPDYLLKPLFYPIDVNEQLFKKFVCIVNLETSTYCNRKCEYCPVSLNNSRKNQLYMAEELFNKILLELKSINYSSTIVFNLYNEPLADKDIFFKIKQIRLTLPNAFLMFNSNGDYVDIDTLNNLSEIGLNALYVTLHQPVNRIYKLDDRLQDFQKFFNKLNIHTTDKSLKDGNIESNINWNGMRLRVMANNWTKYGNSRAGAIDSLNAPETRIFPCVRPLREFTISYNGDVFPCCQFFPDIEANKKYIIDNALSTSIFTIYASHTLAKWRENLFTFGKKAIPCDSCKDEDFSKSKSWNIRESILNRLRNL